MSSESYISILIQIAVALGFVVFTLIASYLLGPKVRGKQKDDAFECGVEVKGDARSSFSVKYFMTAILFVLFDVEIIFFYPYAVSFREFGVEGFVAVLVFVAVFLVGYFYALKREERWIGKNNLYN